MARRRKTKRVHRRKHHRRTVRKTSKRRPIGYAKVRGGYALVYGSKRKPRVGRKFKTKTGLVKHVRKMYRR